MSKVLKAIRQWVRDRSYNFQPEIAEKLTRLSACLLILGFLVFLIANQGPADWRSHSETVIPLATNLVIGLAIVFVLLHGLVRSRG